MQRPFVYDRAHTASMASATPGSRSTEEFRLLVSALAACTKKRTATIAVPFSVLSVRSI